MRLWFDPCLPIPRDFDVRCVSARAALKLLRTRRVTAISIGFDEESGGTEVLALSMVIESLAIARALPRLDWRIHAPRPERMRAMIAALELADRHWSDQEGAMADLAVTRSGRLICWGGAHQGRDAR